MRDVDDSSLWTIAETISKVGVYSVTAVAVVPMMCPGSHRCLARLETTRRKYFRMDTSPAISVVDLKKTYRLGLFGRRRVYALQGVSLDVEAGEIFGLLGPNGAGKTTLIKVLLGIVKRSSGSASVLGHAAGDRRSRMRIGYLPEHHRIPRHLTGYSALDYYGQLSYLALREIRAKRDEVLELVGLEKWGKTPVSGYSKGMQQRLGLAQSMLHDPDLLILDEPTDGVDPVGRADMRDTLFRLKEEGKTIFVNSHLLQEIELVCDRVAILQLGLVRHVGPVRDLTEAASNTMTLEVDGDEDTVRSIVEELLIGTSPVVATVDDVVKISVDTPEQQLVDRLVDELRAAGVSVYSMSRNRLTLEQAFLDLVDPSQITE